MQTVDVPATMERMTPGVPQTQRLRQVVQVAVGISQERVQQRIMELEHQSQLTLAFIQKELECETDEVSERSEFFDELKPDCTNSCSAHADHAAAREEIQLWKERGQELEQTCLYTRRRTSISLFAVYDRSLRKHTDRNPRIMKSIWESANYQTLHSRLHDGMHGYFPSRNIVIMTCRSGRHCFVANAELWWNTTRCSRRQHSASLMHLSELDFRQNTCAGNCSECSRRSLIVFQAHCDRVKA